MKNQEINFLAYGHAFVGSTMRSIIEKAEEIEEKYGVDARLQFESGIAIAVPQYANMLYFEGKGIKTNDIIKPVRNEEPIVCEETEQEKLGR